MFENREDAGLTVSLTVSTHIFGRSLFLAWLGTKKCLQDSQDLARKHVDQFKDVNIILFTGGFASQTR